jgi:L-alanine-DL-glutamate epimerase-like enolase superfamily enzyme
VRVRRIDVLTASLPLERGFSHFTGRVDALEEVFVRLTADDGSVGWGEIRGNVAYFSGDTPAAILATLRDCLAPLVLGRTLAERATLPDLFDRAAMGNAAAKAVLDIALHDLGARAAGVPLFEWLGGRRLPRIDGAECIFYGSAEAAAEQARAYVAAGFRILKIRVGMEPFDLDVVRLRAVREAVGDQIRLAVDANQAWTVPESIRRIRALEGFGLECVEQPVAGRDLLGMAEVARAVGVPLMADESLYSPQDAMTLIRLGAAGMFHIKLAKAGGLQRARQVMVVAEAARLPYVAGQMNEGMLATVAAAHAALAAAPKYAELYGADGIVDDPTPGGVHRDGQIVVPEGPGLGVVPDEARLRPACSLSR